MVNLIEIYSDSELKNSKMNIIFLDIQGKKEWNLFSQEVKKKLLINIYKFYNNNLPLPDWLANITNTEYEIFPELILPDRNN